MPEYRRYRRPTF